MKTYPLLLSLGGLSLLYPQKADAQKANNKEVKQPNIVFILADDMGYGDVSALNNESKIQTPNIDRIAKGGVVFTDAHSSSAVSTPTRYGILTGRYNWRSTLKSGVLYGYDKTFIQPDRLTMASMLKQRGYQTACIGKWHLGWTWNNIENGKENIDFTKPIADGPTTRGFDYFYGIAGSLDMDPYIYVENTMPTSQPDRITQGKSPQFWRKGPTGSDFTHEDCLPNFTRRAVNYISEQSKQSDPFFLYFPLPSPHTPIVPTKEFQGKSGLTPYADFVLMVDWAVGEVVKSLEAAGVADNTIIVFTADNGCSPSANIKLHHDLGHKPNYIFRGHKADLYDGGHRIPCIVKWGNGAKPHEVSQTVCLTDFMATFAELTGYNLKDNEGEDSYNILPLIKNPNYRKPIREAVVHHSITGQFSIRQGDWKLLLSNSSGGWSYPRPGKDVEAIKAMPKYQLYNLKDDIKESRNLYPENQQKTEELRKLLIKYIEDGRSTKGAPQKNDDVEIWKQVEYFM